MKDESETQPDRSVSAVARTIAILNAFVKRPGPLSLGDLEEETGLFKSAILRYMITLVGEGMVARNSDGTYRLGTQVIRLAEAFERAVDYPDLIKPVLHRLVNTLGETASFYIREEQDRVCVFRQNSPRSLRVNLQLGDTHPLDETSTGRVLAHGAETPKVDGSFARVSSGLIDPLTTSISVPVYGAAERLIGALTVSGPIGRFQPNDTEVARILIAEASALSHTMGSTERYQEEGQQSA